jgi:NADPH2:quinone reductase
VLGTAGGPEKISRARANGCDEVIDYEREDVAARVKALTGGAGVSAVFDSVGRATFTASLDSLRPRGLLALFGQSSGVVPPFDLSGLASRGSLYVTRPSLWHYLATRNELLDSAAALFDRVTRGDVRIEIGQTFPLHDVASAHRALEARKTVGSTLLLP